jgi:molecular chaperone DnaJ
VSPTGTFNDAQSSKTGAGDASLSDNNGTTSFTHPSLSSKGGWVSRTWQRIRELTGF